MKPFLYFRINELEEDLKIRSEAEKELELHTKDQELKLKELEDSLSQVEKALSQRKLEVSAEGRDQ